MSFRTVLLGADSIERLDLESKDQVAPLVGLGDMPTTIASSYQRVGNRFAVIAQYADLDRRSELPVVGLLPSSFTTKTIDEVYELRGPVVFLLAERIDGEIHPVWGTTEEFRRLAHDARIFAHLAEKKFTPGYPKSRGWSWLDSVVGSVGAGWSRIEYHRDFDTRFPYPVLDLAVPYEEKDAAKAAGAIWNQDRKLWEYDANKGIDSVRRWIRPGDAPIPISDPLPSLEEFERFVVGHDWQDRDSQSNPEKFTPPSEVSLRQRRESEWISLVIARGGEMYDRIYDRIAYEANKEYFPRKREDRVTSRSSGR